MIGIISMPHRMADPMTVVPPAWILAETGGILGDILEDWSPESPLKLVAQTEILAEDFARSCGLDIQDEIVVTASWRCPATHMRGFRRSDAIRLEACSGAIPLEVVVPAGVADHEIALRTTISLHKRNAKRDDLAAAVRQGSILWYDHPTGRPITLGSTRFPVVGIDFAATGFGEAGSCWRLVIDTTDMTASFASSVRLLLNTRNPRIVSAVTEGWRDPGSSVVRNLIAFAVQRDLVHAALDHAGDLAQLDADPGSTGEALQAVLRERFPDLDPREVRKERDRDPLAFETHLQARLGLLQGGDGT